MLLCRLGSMPYTIVGTIIPPARTLTNLAKHTVRRCFFLGEIFQERPAEGVAANGRRHKAKIGAYTKSYNWEIQSRQTKILVVCRNQANVGVRGSTLIATRTLQLHAVQPNNEATIGL